MFMYRHWRAFAKCWALLVLATVLLFCGISYAVGHEPPVFDYIRNAALIWAGSILFVGIIVSVAEAGNF